MRSRRELDFFVCAFEGDVEPREERVYVWGGILGQFRCKAMLFTEERTIIPGRLQLKRRGKRQILLLRRPQIDVFDHTRIRDDSF